MNAKEASELTKKAKLNQKKYESVLSKIKAAAEKGDDRIDLTVEELGGGVRTRLMESGYEIKGYANRHDIMYVSWWKPF